MLPTFYDRHISLQTDRQTTGWTGRQTLKGWHEMLTRIIDICHGYKCTNNFFFKMNFSIQMFNFIYLFIEANVLYCPSVLAFCKLLSHFQDLVFLCQGLWFYALKYNLMSYGSIKCVSCLIIRKHSCLDTKHYLINHEVHYVYFFNPESKHVDVPGLGEWWWSSVWFKCWCFILLLISASLFVFWSAYSLTNTIMLYIDQHNYMINIIELLLINKFVRKFYVWSFFYQS